MLVFKRGQGKHNANCVLKDAYKRYKGMARQPVTERQYIEICKAFNNFLMLDVLCRSAEVNIGALGSISIRKYKCKPKIRDGKLVVSHMPVNYKATKEFWEKNPEAYKKRTLIRLTNEHTNNYRYRFFWDRTTSKVSNKSYYSFIALRKYGRMLNDVLKDDGIIIDFFLDETKLRPKRC